VSATANRPVAAKYAVGVHGRGVCAFASILYVLVYMWCLHLLSLVVTRVHDRALLIMGLGTHIHVHGMSLIWNVWCSAVLCPGCHHDLDLSLLQCLDSTYCIQSCACIHAYVYNNFVQPFDYLG